MPRPNTLVHVKTPDGSYRPALTTGKEPTGGFLEFRWLKPDGVSPGNLGTAPENHIIWALECADPLCWCETPGD